MEELLNKLIQRGWKPFGIEGIKEFHLKAYECERGTNKIMIKHFEGFFTDGIKTSDHPGDIGTRMYVVYGLKHITAKESGLWQFVCENGMIKKNSNDDKYNSWQKNMYNRYLKRDRAYAKYRLIESALCSEEALEEFLLDNINVKGK